MLNRPSPSESINILPEIIHYFAEQTKNDYEQQAFIKRLQLLQQWMLEEYNLATINHDNQMQQYIISISNKLADLKHVIETADDKHRHKAFINVVTAAIPLVDNNKTRKNQKINAMGFCLVGALFGISLAVLILAATMAFPLTITSVLITAAIGAVVGGAYGMHYGWNMSQNTVHRPTRIYSTVKSLQHGEHLLFSPVKPMQESKTEEVKYQINQR